MDSQLSVQCSTSSNNCTSNQIATSSNYQENKSRQRKPQRDRINFLPEKSVYISPLPKAHGDLTHHLLTLGKIKKLEFKRNFALVEFYDRYCINIYNIFLN